MPMGLVLNMASCRVNLSTFRPIRTVPFWKSDPDTWRHSYDKTDGLVHGRARAYLRVFAGPVRARRRALGRGHPVLDQVFIYTHIYIYIYIYIVYIVYIYISDVCIHNIYNIFCCQCRAAHSESLSAPGGGLAALLLSGCLFARPGQETKFLFIFVWPEPGR